MDKTNSYKKYHDIIVFVNNQEESEVTVMDIQEQIGLGRKQTVRCMAEIADVSNEFELVKIGRATGLKKVKGKTDDKKDTNIQSKGDR